jgi:hypothetical protein
MGDTQRLLPRSRENAVAKSSNSRLFLSVSSQYSPVDGPEEVSADQKPGMAIVAASADWQPA